jgi:hypothetical protein
LILTLPRADLTPWSAAPVERQPIYFPVYAAVSVALQTTLRHWVREWFVAHTEDILPRRLAAQSLLVYQAAYPFAARSSHLTYDVQQPDLIALAFSSARSRLPAILSALTVRLDTPWSVREQYFPYLAKEIVAGIAANPGKLYRMLNAETWVMNALLKFARNLVNIGTPRAEVLVRRAVSTHLRRFSTEFDLSERLEELLATVTQPVLACRTHERKRSVADCFRVPPEIE